MAFWHRKKKKQNSLRAEENAQEQNLSQEVAEEMTGEEKRLSEKELAAERVVPKGKAEQKRFVQACLESIRECERQTEIARAEYGQVTEYLTDIQKIDRIAGEERENCSSFANGSSVCCRREINIRTGHSRSQSVRCGGLTGIRTS